MSAFYISLRPDGSYQVIRITERVVGSFKTHDEAKAAFEAAYQREERLGGRHLTTSELQAAHQAITSGAVGPEFMRGES